MLDYIIEIDQNILLYIQEKLIFSYLTPLMILFTKLGDFAIVWLVLGLVLLIKKETRHIAIGVFIAIIISSLLGEGLLKHLIKRPRPYYTFPQIPLLIKESTKYSFPSGHTSNSFAVAYIVSYYKSRIAKLIWGLAAIIAISRIYLFMHYPLDIVGGIILGVFCGFLVSHLNINA